MDQALTAAYNALQSIDQYGGNGFSSFMEVTSDNTWNENVTMGGGAYASFDNFIVDPTNVQVEKTWVACYDGIQRCNIEIMMIILVKINKLFLQLLWMKWKREKLIS